MKFDNEKLKDWKEYSIGRKIIIMQTVEENDCCEPIKRHEFYFDSEEELNKWLNDYYTLGAYETIERITEGIVYEFDWEKYINRWD